METGPPAVTLAQALPDRLLERARMALAKSEAYVRSRQSYNGGFCFYRWQGVDEPNLHDTWHAVATLALLGAETPRADEIARFLEAFEPAGLDYCYCYAFTLDALGRAAAMSRDRMESIRALKVRASSDSKVPVSARLETALRILSLRNRFADIRIKGDVDKFLDELRRDGGYGDKPNLHDTRLALSIQYLCALPADSSTRAFVDSLQTSGFGFTATRDSMLSNLDVLHAGVNACALLGLPVRHPEDVIKGILACQTGEGGFARASDALPDLAYTHLAVQALARLGAFVAAPVPTIPFEIGL